MTCETVVLKVWFPELPENLLEMHILGRHPGPNKSETLGGRAWQSVFLQVPQKTTA